jgi:transposase-like protein
MVWPAALPWLLWLWQELSLLWPWLARQAEWRLLGWLLWQGQRLLLLWLAAGWLQEVGLELLRQPNRALSQGHFYGLPLGMGVIVQEEKTSSVALAQDDKGYTVTLQGTFTLQVAKDDPFRQRFLAIFLSLLDDPQEERGSRRTRDGRTPCLRQQQLAAWLSVPQPDISRWLKYWLGADWRRLLSLHTQEILTLEVQQRIVQVFARFPWWNDEQVYQHLQAQGLAVSQSQVRQAAQESGWSSLRQELRQRYHLSAQGFRPKDGWLVGQLLAQVETLLSKLEAGARLTPEEQLNLSDLQALGAAVGLEPPAPLKPLPWLMRVEHLLWGEWEALPEGQVCCPHCGSSHVVRKSNQPRLKWYYDAQGQLVSIEVYRYYCRNQACQHGSFTNLPPGLVLYSRHRLETHLLALQAYTWGQSKYRYVATSLGVSSMTAYRWVSAFGDELLPVAALFGVVKSSGVMGVDEKYVLVPKNDKPPSDLRRWMYVYFAVDAYTYDLLHIAIYPHNTKESALAFLLAVRAKGYHPRVVVTDLRVDYGPALAQVFPQAKHHECLFHAEKDVEEHLREVYGSRYAESHPEAVALKAMIHEAVAAKTKCTAQERYEKVLALRQPYVALTPGVVVIFDFLERHWPKLVNGMESELIPRTNNSTEQVIRRFDQHYQNFCGFETLETAQRYLGVFEKVYRFTPFSPDAQERIRGKSPLQLAGYDVSRLPMSRLCSGWSLAWQLQLKPEHVPNS